MRVYRISFQLDRDWNSSSEDQKSTVKHLAGVWIQQLMSKEDEAAFKNAEVIEKTYIPRAVVDMSHISHSEQVSPNNPIEAYLNYVDVEWRF